MNIHPLIKQENNRILFSSRITHQFLNKELKELEKLKKEYDEKMEDILKDNKLKNNEYILSNLNYNHGYLVGAIQTIKKTLEYLSMNEKEHEGYNKK